MCHMYSKMNPDDDRLFAGALGLINDRLMLVQAYVGIARRNEQARRRRRRRRRWHVRPWISRRPQLGLYDQLMVELRAEDPASFQNFLRMPPPMFDEQLERLAQD